MSIATVVTRGYGSFGSVNLLPTLGYSVGAPAAETFGPIEFTVPKSLLEFTVPSSRLEFTVTQSRLEYTIDK